MRIPGYNLNHRSPLLPFRLFGMNPLEYLSALQGGYSRLNSIISLFKNGEQGVWYDPSDLSTLFQDAAGTIPVTAPGQPVGLMLDKSGRGNHAFQPTAASRPTIQYNATTKSFYLNTDGSDDWMQTNAIDFTGTDEVSVFTGVRKLSDAAAAILLELSSHASSSAGAFYMSAPESSAIGFAFKSRGTLAVNTANYQAAAPVSAVVSARGSISADLQSISVNGGTPVTLAADQGTGNYGNYPLYLFRRGGTTFPFNGHFYGLTIVGRLTTDAETRNVERLYAAKTGVTLA